MTLAVIILAAGQGTRMKSQTPKVLHDLGGKPLLGHVLETARSLGACQRIVVYGHHGERVRQTFNDQSDIHWVHQEKQQGTGHAVGCALPMVAADCVLVLYGDVPLITPDTLRPLVDQAQTGKLALLTAWLDQPDGYGRIVRDAQQRVQSIVEHKDADADTRAINEINTGVLAAPTAALAHWIANLNNHNSQQEYYLTDVVAQAATEGFDVRGVRANDPVEAQGVNDRVQLAELERYYQTRQVNALMRQGVSFRDPMRADIRGTLNPQTDIQVDVNVIFEGQVTLGQGVHVGPFCVIRDCEIGENVTIHAHCHLEGVRIESGAQVGPFARLRTGTHLGPHTKVGNFVETKNSRLETGAKVNHLSYVGDAQVGEHANVGAGTITCNYDGANKHKTVIGHHAFIGSNTALVAPVTVGDHATVGAGSTLSRDVPDHALALTRAPLRQWLSWARPVKKPRT